MHYCLTSKYWLALRLQYGVFFRAWLYCKLSLLLFLKAPFEKSSWWWIFKFDHQQCAKVKYVGGVCEEEEALLWMAKDDGITPNHMVLRCFVDEICGPHNQNCHQSILLGTLNPLAQLVGFMVSLWKVLITTTN
jgi:hypothetical protein